MHKGPLSTNLMWYPCWYWSSNCLGSEFRIFQIEKIRVSKRGGGAGETRFVRYNVSWWYFLWLIFVRNDGEYYHPILIPLRIISWSFSSWNACSSQRHRICGGERSIYKMLMAQELWWGWLVDVSKLFKVQEQKFIASIAMAKSSTLNVFNCLQSLLLTSLRNSH